MSFVPFIMIPYTYAVRQKKDKQTKKSASDYITSIIEEHDDTLDLLRTSEFIRCFHNHLVK